MKLKNVKYYSASLLLATTLGFTGCSKTIDSNYNNSSEQQLQNDNLENESFIDKETKKLINDINRHFNNSIVLHYYSSTGIITITGPYEEKNIPKLTEKLYNKLNELLEDSTIQTLEIRNIGNEIDFSKLNLSNIKNLTLDSCKTDFNYEPFKNQEYQNINFEGLTAEPAKEIIKSSSNKETNIEFVNYKDNQEATNFIKFLADNQIPVNNLTLATTEINKDDYTMLSKTNISNIDITFTNPSEQTYNLELYPNQNINSITIWHNGKNIELGNIQIVSECPLFYFAFNGYDSKITTNTNFSLPNFATASISSKYESGNALQDLSNLYAFDFYDYNTYKVISYDCETTNLEELIDEYTKAYQIKKELQ